MNNEVKEARKRIKKELSKEKSKKIELEKLFNKMLDSVEEWYVSYLEDGIYTTKSAMKSAHDKIKKEFGDEKYEDFCIWLDQDSPGPYG